MSHSKRLCGVADAAPLFGASRWLPPKIRLIQTLILCLLCTDVVSNGLLVATYCRHEESARAEMLPNAPAMVREIVGQLDPDVLLNFAADLWPPAIGTTSGSQSAL